MSHPQNEQWLEAAYEHFTDAVGMGNYALAKDVIADTFDAGFAKEARQISEELREMSIYQFGQPSPYQIEL
jgi:hypothetical protein